jgi:outer membrane protein OmpA-like peptidoglycan-associated protein
VASEHEGWLDQVTVPPVYETLAVRRGVLYGRRARPWQLPTAVAVLGLGLAAAGQFGIVRPNVERGLDSTVSAALSQAGFSGMQVEVDGRDVTLNGTLPSKADIPGAISLVQGVQGVRRIREIFVSTPDAPASASPRPPAGSPRAVPSGAPAPIAQLAAVGATVDGGTVTLVGGVPNQAARADLVQRLAATFGKARVVDQLVVDPTTGGYGLQAFATVLSDLGPRAIAGSVSVHAGRMSVAGAVPDDAVHKAIARDAVGAVGSDPAALSDTLVADPAVTTVSDTLAADQLAALPPIPFADGDATVSPTATRMVAVAATILLRHPNLRVQVEGHTDANGDPVANQRLSRDRAGRVVQGLQAAGVPGLQLSAFGFGSTRPLVAGTGPLADALNRRVVIAAA